MDKFLGLYIHIPFCNKKCDYCDFTSFVTNTNMQKKYLKALFKEIDLQKDKFKNKIFDTIYIGGGTPSAVFDGFILKLSKKLYKSFNFAKNTEFTIEVNPSSFTKEKFEEYVLAKINRISMGVQCLNSKLMSFHGRNQTKQQIKNVFKILKSNKFENISCDVMIGLPNQKSKDIQKTIKFLIKQDVKHISTYTLQVEEKTKLAERIKCGLTPKSESFMVNNYEKVVKDLKKAGFDRYEISNFAKTNFQSRHNSKYWQDVDYLGLGLSSSSYINKTRYTNTKNLNNYFNCLKNNKLPIEIKEKLDKTTQMTESIMLSLRTSKGLDLNAFKQKYKIDLLKEKNREISNLQKLNMITIENDKLIINPDKFSVSNSIILEMI